MSIAFAQAKLQGEERRTILQAIQTQMQQVIIDGVTLGCSPDVCVGFGSGGGIDSSESLGYDQLRIAGNAWSIARYLLMGDNERVVNEEAG